MNTNHTRVVLVHGGNKAYTQEQIDEIMAAALHSYLYVVGSANEMANLAMTDADMFFSKNDYYKNKEGRKWLKMAMRHYADYESQIRIQLQDFSRINGRKTDGRDEYTLWLDITDHFDEVSRPLLQKLYFAIKLAMDKMKIVQNTDGLAYAWTAAYAIDISILVFDRAFEYLQRIQGVDVSPLFTNGRFGGIKKCWAKVTEAYDLQFLPKNDKRFVPLNDENIRLGVEALLNCFTSERILLDAAKYGIDNNMEIFSDEDKKTLSKNQAS